VTQSAVFAAYFARAGLWALLGKLSAALGLLFVTVVLARLMPKDDFGAYALAYSLLTVAASVALLGTHLSVARAVAEAEVTPDVAASRRAIVRTAWSGSAALLLTCALMASPAGAWLWRAALGAPALAALSGLLALWLAAQGARFYLAGVLRGLKDLRGHALVHQIVFFALLAGGLSIVWLAGARLDLSTAIAASALASLVAAVLGIALLIAPLRRHQAKVEKSGPASSLLGVSLSLLLIETAPTLAAQIALWLVAGGAGLAQAAVFAVALRLIQVVLLPAQVLEIALRPGMAGLRARHAPDERQRIVRALATLAALPALLVLAALLAGGEGLTALLFGPGYETAPRLFLLLALGQGAALLLGPAEVPLTMLGHERPVLVVTLATTLAFVVVALLLVEQHGVLGVAGCLSAATALRAFLLWRLCARRLALPCHVILSPVTLARGFAEAERVR